MFNVMRVGVAIGISLALASAARSERSPQVVPDVDAVYRAWADRRPDGAADKVTADKARADIATAVLVLHDPAAAAAKSGGPAGPAVDQAVQALLSIRSPEGLAVGLRSQNLGSQAAAAAGLSALAADADVAEGRQIAMAAVDYLETVKPLERGGEDIVVQRRATGATQQALRGVLTRLRDGGLDADLVSRAERQLAKRKRLP